MDEFGSWAFFSLGMVVGVIATAGLGMLILMNGDTSGNQTIAAPTTIEVQPEDVTVSQAVFASTCSACHGADATGVQGLGPSLVGNVFVQSLSDAELVEFIATGRPASHPDNTTGIDMPPRGGNPSLTPQDLADVAGYLRSLQG